MEKFWRNVRKGPGCWAWTGHTIREGYGRLRMGSRSDRTRRQDLAHRVSYEIHFGFILKGKIVRHTCDNPNCVNPYHLEVGTDLDNTLDKIHRGRSKVKIKNEDVSRIRELRNDGIPLKILAKQFGVAESTISRIAAGIRRPHV